MGKLRNIRSNLDKTIHRMVKTAVDAEVKRIMKDDEADIETAAEAVAKKAEMSVGQLQDHMAGKVSLSLHQASDILEACGKKLKVDQG